MHHLWLIIHLLAATVWVGGHLVLSLGYLPKALKQKDATIIRQFEAHYEKIGIPALVLLIITGIVMALDLGVLPSQWFSFSYPLEKMVSLKLSFLGLTLLLGVHARVFLIPKLDESKLRSMAFHIILITITGIAMLITGSFGRLGGL